VGTLLLQIGEVGHSLAKKNEDKDVSEDGEWSITFEQFYASILTETPLIDFFSKNHDIEASLKEFSSIGPKRAPSEVTYDGSRSVFYV